MLANKFIIIGNPFEIYTYGDYTTIQLKVADPYREINSQLLNNMGFGNTYYDYYYEHSSGERFQTNTINLNPVRNI